MTQQKDEALSWLEEVEGQRALAWVGAQNQRSLARLRGTPTFAPFKSEALATLEAKDRLVHGAIRAGHVYNFWQDAQAVRGLWRRATWDSYQAGTPQWEVLLDIDELGRREQKSYVFGGASCLEPHYENCLIRLSEGGSDAAEWREFDVPSRRFVADGFRLPASKSGLAWVDRDTVLFENALSEDARTDSGYPAEIRLWRRGQQREGASVLYRGRKTDVSVSAFALLDGDQRHVFVARHPTFYTSELFLWRSGVLTKLALPEDAAFQTVFKGRLLFISRSPLPGIVAGSLVSVGLEGLVGGTPRFEALFQPTSSQALDTVQRTKDHLLVSVMDMVRHKLWRYEMEEQGAAARWQSTLVALPDTGLVSLVAVDELSERALVTYEDFLTPRSLYALDGRTLRLGLLQRLPARFKTEGLVIRQESAVSSDGTEVPFFIVHRRDLPRDGRQPTLLYGYGGFEVPLQPTYSELLGKLWLERGGVFVLANIRGGGEFGPAWHQAALKEHRQKAFDDFIAISRQLIDRKITSPAHLGIQGGSNGGLLVGVAFTQRPELYGAVICQVPLLDMLRYHRLLAGASWMAEYGNPDDPEMAKVLRGYSPFHNIAPERAHPEILFVTSTRDDRVHPGHARKMAAKLEAMNKPFLYFENTEGGHWASADLQQKAEILALEYSYLWSKLGAAAK